MTGYGHELRFGTFVTPLAAQPQKVVDLAVATEAAGLDLVTVQDHPYQPRFLDAWTLLTWMAARTQRIRVSGNVLNLPLRRPAVLAKAAASLDLLSGGRFELALGAGAFWEAIGALGAPVLSPGASVEALGQAIDVIRGLWDVSDPARLRAGGAYHRVDGAKRGPAPAHDVEIWLGAYKPRMLHLVGEKADGWLPSMGYLSSQRQIVDANAAIDEAAAAAGRDPSAVRRLLNVDAGPAAAGSELAERLAALAVEHGFSTFIFSTDDEAAVARLGHAVAPAVRELVGAGG